MKVLVVTGIFPPDIGGPATYVPSISSELVKRGHRVTVVTLSDSLKRNDHLYPFRVVRIRRHLLKPWRMVLTVAILLRRARRADVLFVNGLYIETVIANVFLRKPMVQKVVADWAWERASNWRWVDDKFEDFQKATRDPRVKALKALRTFYIRRADRIITPSRYLARWIAQLGIPEEKVRIVYNAVERLNGIQPATIPMAARVNLRVVTVGRLIALKQIDLLIQAVSRLKDVGLVVVGDGPERERLEKLAQELGVAERVYFTGMTSKEAMLSFLCACDLFVLNSTHEGFPYVLLEAMSLGLPVVATAVGGIPEIVQDGKNGFLIAPNANGELPKKLAMLLSCPSVRKRLAAGAKRTVEQFRFSAVVEETESVLRNTGI